MNGKAAALRRALLLGTALVPLAGAPVLANPEGGQVAAGSATIERTGNTLTVTQGSQRAVIDWRSFSIGAGETARFGLPSSSAAVLNKVLGPDPSALMGRLESNGQVYLLNPNGILVGPNGRIETGGFVGSTLGLDAGAFMRGGPLRFDGTSDAGVTVLGKVRASTGDVLLVAAQVANRGEIAAPNGRATLAAGAKVLYIPDGQSDVVIETAAAAPAEGASVDNEGAIAAASVQLAAAGSPYAVAVNNGGQVTATRVENSGGRLLLSAGGGDLVNGGSVTAAGGAVALDGRRVAQTGRIDTAAEDGGGAVEIRAGEALAVTAAAEIDASATGRGDGGTVNVISTGATNFAGRIASRGGAAGGDGGQVEVSGHDLGVTGIVDVTAAAGRTGRLLLDPDDITIVSGSATAPSGISGGLWAFASDPGSQTISVGAISTLLNSGHLELQANNSLTVESAASLTSASSNTLTLNAPILTVNGSLSLANGTLVLTAPSGNTLTSASGAAITASSLRVTGDFGTVTLAGRVSATSLQFTQSNSSITIDNTLNAIRSVTFPTGGASVTALDLRTTTDLEFRGSISGSTATVAAGGNLVLRSGAVIDTGSATLAATGGYLNNEAGAALLPNTNATRRLYSATDGTGYSQGGLGFTEVAGVSYPNTGSPSSAVVYIASLSGQPVITITADSFTRTYGQSDPTFTASYSGGTAGDLTTLPQFRIVQGGTTNAGSYTIEPYGAASATNRISYVTGHLTVEQAVLTITANDAAMTYGDPRPTFGATTSGFIGSDTSALLSSITLTATGGTNPDAGTYSISVNPVTVATPSGGSSPNYRVTYVDGTLRVARAPLTVTATPVSAVYGQAVPTPTLTFSGFVNDIDATYGPAQFATVLPETGSAAGTYAITLAHPNPTSNYSVTFVGADATITPARLTITPVLSKVYGAALPTALTAASYDGLVAGDTPASLTRQPTLSSAATAASGVGSYSLSAGDAASPNYQITYRTGTLTVTPAPLTVGAADVTRNYGSANPAFTPTFSGLVNGDDASAVTGLTLTSTATAGSGAGSYGIVPAGATAANYSITYTTGRLTVEPVPLVIMGTGAATYGRPDQADVTFFYSGFVNGDTAASLAAGPRFTTSATATSHPGLYSLLATGASSPNYIIRYQPGVLTLSPAPLVVSPAATTRTYGNTGGALSLVYSGLVNGETAGDVFSTLPQASLDSSLGAGTYNIGMTTHGVSKTNNYVVTYQITPITVRPAPLTIRAPSVSIDVGASVPKLTPEFSGLQGGDTGAEYALQAALPKTSAATGGSVEIELVGSNSNYDVTYVPGMLRVLPPVVILDYIPPATLEITGTVDLSGIDLRAIPDSGPVIRIKTTVFNFNGAAFEEESKAIDEFLAVGSLTEPPMTRSDLLGMLHRDPDGARGMLLPFMIGHLEAVLAKPEGAWTESERAFVQQFASYIEAQRKATAAKAEADYKAWQAAQQEDYNKKLEKVQGIAQVYQAAILASDPAIPPPELLAAVSVGLTFDSDEQLMAFAGAKDGYESMLSTVVATSMGRANEQADWFLSEFPASKNAATNKVFADLKRDLASDNPEVVQRAQEALNRHYNDFVAAGRISEADAEGIDLAPYAGAVGEVGKIAHGVGLLSGNPGKLKDVVPDQVVETFTPSALKAGATDRKATMIRQLEALVKKGPDEAKKAADLRKMADLETDAVKANEMREAADKIDARVADTVKRLASKKGYKIGEEVGNRVDDLLTKVDDILEFAPDAAKVTNKAIVSGSKVMKTIGSVLSVAGVVLEVAGNVAQIAMTSVQYASVADYDAKFKTAMADANKSVSVADLKSMVSSAGGKEQMLNYMAAMMVTGGAGPGKSLFALK